MGEFKQQCIASDQTLSRIASYNYGCYNYFYVDPKANQTQSTH